jgi:hypothetical protein
VSFGLVCVTPVAAVVSLMSGSLCQKTLCCCFIGGALVCSGGVVFVVVEGERDVLVDGQWLFPPLAPSLFVWFV